MKKLDGEFRFALGKSMPVLFGYVTLGLGYGLYMHNLGFSFWYPTLMAPTIYGGSVEFVIANMLVQHFNPLERPFNYLGGRFSSVILCPINAQTVPTCWMAKVAVNLWPN